MILKNDIFSEFRQATALGIDTSPNEVEYSTDGLMLGATQNNVLKLYSSLAGTIQNIIHIPNIQKFSFIYPNSVIHSASNTMYLLSTFDNQYIRSFNSHDSQIRAISVCPREDSCMSSSNECVSYWDLRKKNPAYKIDAIDPLGCVSLCNDYAIAIGNGLLKIYDKRNTKGPKITAKLPEREFKEMFYSPNGAFLIISSEKHHLLVDSEGMIKTSVTLEKAGSACITPDSKYFLCCSENLVFVYYLSTGRKVHTFETSILDNTKVRFNPRYGQFVSVSSLLNFWAIGE